MNAIYEITPQQLENVLNEVENQTECWITKKMVVMLTVCKFKLQCQSYDFSLFKIFSATNRLKFKFNMKKIKYLKWLLFSHVMNIMTHQQMCYSILQRIFTYVFIFTYIHTHMKYRGPLFHIYIYIFTCVCLFQSPSFSH